MLGLPAQSIAAPARGALADGAMTLETDLGYGVAVLPEHRIKVGAHVQHFGGSMREGVGLTWESAAPKGDQGVIPGLKVRIEYERPTSFMAGGAGIAVNYGIRF